MDFLRKYFAGQMTPQEEVQVQDWLVEHSDDPQVQEALLSIMSEFEAEDMQLSSVAYANVCRRIGKDRISLPENLPARRGLRRLLPQRSPHILFRLPHHKS